MKTIRVSMIYIFVLLITLVCNVKLINALEDDNQNNINVSENLLSNFYRWQEENGDKYYYNENGSYQVGLFTIENEIYYFNDEGKMQTGWQEVNEKNTILKIMV